MRSLMLLLALIGTLALGVPAALASEASDDDGITAVSVSLSDTAEAGEDFTVAESITNLTDRTRIVRVTQTLTGPDGATIFSLRYPLILRANKTLAFELEFTFPANIPPGTYSLTLTAGGASATATTQVS
jgi:hypothetical protein